MMPTTSSFRAEEGQNPNDGPRIRRDAILKAVSSELQLIVLGAVRGPVPDEYLVAHLELVDEAGRPDEGAIRQWMHQEAAELGGIWEEDLEPWLEELDEHRGTAEFVAETDGEALWLLAALLEPSREVDGHE